MSARTQWMIAMDAQDEETSLGRKVADADDYLTTEGQWKTGVGAIGAYAGGKAGAAIGSAFLPGVGTFIGAGIGTALGYVAGARGGEEIAERREEGEWMIGREDKYSQEGSEWQTDLKTGSFYKSARADTAADIIKAGEESDKGDWYKGAIAGVSAGFATKAPVDTGQYASKEAASKYAGKSGWNVLGAKFGIGKPLKEVADAGTLETTKDVAPRTAGESSIRRGDGSALPTRRSARPTTPIATSDTQYGKRILAHGDQIPGTIKAIPQDAPAATSTYTATDINLPADIRSQLDLKSGIERDKVQQALSDQLKSLNMTGGKSLHDLSTNQAMETLEQEKSLLETAYKGGVRATGGENSRFLQDYKGMIQPDEILLEGKAKREALLIEAGGDKGLAEYIQNIRQSKESYRNVDYSKLKTDELKQILDQLDKEEGRLGLGKLPKYDIDNTEALRKHKELKGGIGFDVYDPDTAVPYEPSSAFDKEQIWKPEVNLEGIEKGLGGDPTGEDKLQVIYDKVSRGEKLNATEQKEYDLSQVIPKQVKARRARTKAAVESYIEKGGDREFINTTQRDTLEKMNEQHQKLFSGKKFKTGRTGIMVNPDEQYSMVQSEDKKLDFWLKQSNKSRDDIGEILNRLDDAKSRNIDLSKWDKYKKDMKDLKDFTGGAIDYNKGIGLDLMKNWQNTDKASKAAAAAAEEAARTKAEAATKNLYRGKKGVAKFLQEDNKGTNWMKEVSPEDHMERYYRGAKKGASEADVKYYKYVSQHMDKEGKTLHEMFGLKNPTTAKLNPGSPEWIKNQVQTFVSKNQRPEYAKDHKWFKYNNLLLAEWRK